LRIHLFCRPCLFAMRCPRACVISLAVAEVVADLCHDLKKHTKGQVMCKDSEDFNPQQNYSFDTFNPRCEALMPNIVVEPTDSHDVKKTVKFAVKHGKEISVRGGGHSYVCNGFKEGSVHLDMRGMKSDITVEYDPSCNCGYVELSPGHTLRDLVDSAALAEYEFAVGTCLSVGVMGFFLHGGSSPRTRFLGNTTISSMTVVTANEERFVLCDGCAHPHLWDAMRQAGSSFGVVTSLTLRLERKVPKKTSWIMPVSGTFEELQPKLFNKVFLERNERHSLWVGLFRWAAALGPAWYLKITMVMSDSDFGCTLEDLQGNRCQDAPFTEQAGAMADQMYGWLSNHSYGNPFGISRTAAQLLANRLIDNPQGALTFDTFWASHFPYGASAEFPPHIPAEVTELPWPQHGDSASVGRFVSFPKAVEQTSVFNDFYRNRDDACWYDIGPIRGPVDDVFVDLSCYETPVVDELRNLSRSPSLNTDMKRYYGLPMWPGHGQEQELKYQYWPNYDQLADTKKHYDKHDLFNIPDGIHPPGAAWPSQDPFAQKDDLIV